MAHSFSATYIHIVYSTKERQPFLADPQLRQDMHRYLAGIAKQQQCGAISVGGVEDHVHLLAHLGRPVSRSDLVRDLKRSSTKWAKTHDPALQGFEWQSGFGVLSVSYSQLGSVQAYIESQEGLFPRRVLRVASRTLNQDG